jgi:DNA-directed RNA polymerase subunit M/transcription elongation factor TFIIS
MNVRETVRAAIADLDRCLVPGYHTLKNVQLNILAAKDELNRLLKTLDAPVVTVECGNCDYEAPAEKHTFAEVDDFNERVSEGETVPYGQCPKCGSLLHAKDPE